jgi:hypothetical protein
VAVVAFVALDEILDARGHVAQLQIATPAQFMGDVFRYVLRPALGGIESDDPDRVFDWPVKRSVMTVSRSVASASASRHTAPKRPRSSFTR